MQVGNLFAARSCPSKGKWSSLLKTGHGGPGRQKWCSGYYDRRLVKIDALQRDIRTHVAAYMNRCCSRQLQSLWPVPTRDTESKQGWRWRSGQAEHQLGSHLMRATEAGRGRRETAAAIATRAQVQWQAVKSILLERMDGSPASADNSKWVIAHAPRQTYNQTSCCTGGRMSRMLQNERPEPAISAPGHRARREKSRRRSTQVIAISDGQDLQQLQEKVVTRK